MFVRTTTVKAARRVGNARVFCSQIVWAQRAFPHNASRPEESDIVIVGGGPAGLALACALGHSKRMRNENLKITLVEAGDLSKIREWTLPEDAFSNRVSSITNASQAFLTDIGAWDHVDIGRTCPIEEMQVWDGLSEARIFFNADGLSSSSGGGKNEPTQMARLTENLNLQRALLRHLSQMPIVRLIDRVKVVDIQCERDTGGTGWPIVRLSNGKLIRARLLIGADGFNSPVRRYAGISSYGWAYDSRAIVATLQHLPRYPFESPNTVAYQRFLPTGPVAFLPLSSTRSSLVWSTKPDIAAALLEADPEVLVNMINAAFRLPDVSMRYLHKVILESKHSGALVTPDQIRKEIIWREKSHSIDETSVLASASSYGSLKTSGSIVPPHGSDSQPPLVTSIQDGTSASFPLRYSHVDSLIGEGFGGRTVLVGDAAHTIHPLAGQGLNLGLEDVQSLVRCIEKAVELGCDIGSYTTLLPYAQDRYFENHKIMSTVDKLHKLYSSSFPSLVLARSIGLEVVNEFDSLKGAIMVLAGAGQTPSNRKGNLNRSLGWTLAGVESLAAAAGTARMLMDTIGAVGSSSLRRLLNSSGAGRR